MTDASLAETIVGLCAECGVGKTIGAADAAKAMAQISGGDELAWREWFPKVRPAAVQLAKEGRIVIFRKGKPADPDDFRGVYRLGLPRSE
jgi:hypothetical protein